MPHQSPGQDRALAYLCSHARRDDTSLPSIRTMARECHVAYATMYKALRRWRVGNGVGTQVSTPVARPAHHQRWEMVLSQLQGDLSHSVFVPGSLLPPVKTLQGRYGVCYATMKAALDAALSDGLLSYERRRYRVPTVRVARDFYSLHVVTRTIPEQLFAPVTSTARAIYRQIEGQCGRRSIVPRMVAYHFMERELVPAYTDRAFPLDQAALAHSLGIVVFIAGLEAVGLPTFLEELCALGRPVVLVDEYGRLGADDIPRASAPVMLCRAASNVAAGRDVGRALRSLGHRRIAYVNPFGGVDWAQDRERGIRDVWGDDDGVVVAESRAPHRDPAAVADLELLRTRLASADSQLPRRLRGGLLARQVTQNLTGAFHRRVQVTHTRRALARIVGDHRVTAWVAANDLAAIVCNDYAREHGIRIPQQVSLVSYDDTLEASFLNLASYTFNSAGMADAALGFLLRPRHSRRKGATPEIVDVPGRIVMRHSLSPPRS